MRMPQAGSGEGPQQQRTRAQRATGWHTFASVRYMKFGLAASDAYPMSSHGMHVKMSKSTRLTWPRTPYTKLPIRQALSRMRSITIPKRSAPGQTSIGSNQKHGVNTAS